MNKTVVYKIKAVFKDKRGSIFDIVENEVRHVGMVTFARKGVIRGNHYHKKSTQFTYVLSGKIRMITANVKGGEKKVFLLESGSFAKIPPRIAHTYEALTKAELLDMTTESRRKSGYEKDTVKVGIGK